MAVPLTVPGIIEDYYPAAFRRKRNLSSPQWVQVFCLHVPVFPERLDGAERIARYFQSQEAANRPASTAFCTDPTGAIRCIPDDEYGASAKGINRRGVHVEMTGYADQTAAEWKDDFSVKTMKVTAKLFALYHLEYGVPVVFVDAAGLKRGERGITTHAEAWKAFGGAYRYDPGKNFPMEFFLDLCFEAIADLTGDTPMAGIDFVSLGDKDPAVIYWKRALRRIGLFEGELNQTYDEDLAEAVRRLNPEWSGNNIKQNVAYNIHKVWMRAEIFRAIRDHKAEIVEYIDERVGG